MGTLTYREGYVPHNKVEERTGRVVLGRSHVLWIVFISSSVGAQVALIRRRRLALAPIIWLSPARRGRDAEEASANSPVTSVHPFFLLPLDRCMTLFGARASRKERARQCWHPVP